MTRPFFQLTKDIEAALARPLPDDAAHQMMSPRPRRGWPEGFHPANVRHAAALLLLFPVAGHAHLVLTVRSETLGRHRGQISLPGGVLEPGETEEQAAVREAHEEIGVDPAEVRTIGRLSPLDIPVSGFRLHPIVAVALHRPTFRPADREVARILEVPLEELLAPGCVAEIERTRDGRIVTAPSFCIGEAQIWGATAMVLAELLVLLGWRADGTGDR
jgi:8-oxo-dGTP pyrophosphatase MutT (NUDIX family)